MKIVKKISYEENYNIDLTDQLKEVDFKILMKAFNDIGIPVKKINAGLMRDYIHAEGDTFKGKDLGIFAAALKEAKVITSRSITERNNKGDYVWWATWAIEFVKKNEVRDGMQVLTSWYDFEKKTWEIKQEGQR